MFRKEILTILVVVMMLGVCTAKADLVFDSGYNIFDDSYPYYDEVGVINDAVLDVLGGQIGKLEYAFDSSGSIYTGQIDSLWTQMNAVVHIYGGDFNWMASFNTVYLHAYDTIYYPDGGLYNYPWLEGKYWMDGSQFSFTLYNDSVYQNIQIIPEPCSVLFMGLGTLILRISKK